MNEALGNPMNPWLADEEEDPPQTETQGKGDRKEPVNPPTKS
jgi:hypothetical protein